MWPCTRELSKNKSSLGKQILRMVPTQNHKFSHSIYTGWSSSSFTSAVIMGVHMGQMSKLGWLIGWSIRDMWADPLYFLQVVFGSICKTLTLFQHIWGLLHKHVVLISIFQADLVSSYICAPTSEGLPVSLMWHLPQSHGTLYTHCFIC
jgi:hypothetical protein